MSIKNKKFKSIESFNYDELHKLLFAASIKQRVTGKNKKNFLSKKNHKHYEKQIKMLRLLKLIPNSHLHIDISV